MDAGGNDGVIRSCNEGVKGMGTKRESSGCERRKTAGARRAYEGTVGRHGERKGASRLS